MAFRFKNYGQKIMVGFQSKNYGCIRVYMRVCVCMCSLVSYVCARGKVEENKRQRQVAKVLQESKTHHIRENGKK